MGRKRGRRNGGSGAAKSSTAQNELSTEAPNQAETNKSDLEKPNKKTTKAKKSNEKTVAVRLADYPKLTKADIMCPICWSTLFEPTTLPCNHSLCEKCFRKHVDETSISCPCCRMRLSVWCRKNMKGKNLLDEVLWERIKKEFPRLVDATLNGEDTQNIFGGGEDAFAESLHSQQLIENDRPVLDGTMCDEPGQIKDELEEMMRQHEKDMEVERAREETASACLIKQLQEEENVQEKDRGIEEQDFLLAKKLQEEFEEQDRRERSMRSQQKSVSVPRNLVNAKSKSSPGRTPKVSQTRQSRPLRSSTASNSSKGKSNSSQNLTKKKNSSNSHNVSRASQDLMTRFLSSSQNQLHSPESPNSSNTSMDYAQACCSKSLPVHDIRYSAFSPTKPSSSLRIIVPTESLAIPISAATENFSPVTSRGAEEFAVSTATPDSINSEVDRHFRPIRGAPKTPPRRRADGTFLPEPKLLRATPVKPTSSTLISAYICSPVKQMPNESKPSCATIEKRISNDSGRSSDDSRSPDAVGGSLATSCKVHESVPLAQPYQNDWRGCISEDYRVTPEDNSATSEKSKKRGHEDAENVDCGSKKAKVGVGELRDGLAPGVHVAQIKEEPGSPSLMEDACDHQHLSFDITCTQGIITIDEEDEEYLEMEKKTFELYRRKAEQEAADRAFALKLQRDLNKEEGTQRGRNQYSLRSWLNRSNAAPVNE